MMIHLARILLVFALGNTFGCSSRSPAVLNQLPADCEQAIVVRPSGPHRFSAKLNSYFKKDGRWQEWKPELDAVVGPNGIVSPTIKREGDGHTPSGIYTLGPAFGYDKTIDTKLNYRQCTDNDFWIDEASDPEYNLWVTGKPQGKSYERMKRDDDAYMIGAVIQYNTKPVVAGKGSAIFFHVWNGPDKPTAGCVAIDRARLAEYLAWLDVRQNPHIIILPSE